IAVVARGGLLIRTFSRHAHTGVATMPTRRRLPLTGRWPLIAAAFLVATAVPLRAQDVAQQGALKDILAKESYIRPPESIEKILMAPWQQNVSLSNQSP